MSTKPHNLQDKILEAALELAETRSWEKVHLHDIAKILRIHLEDIHQYYRDKDALMEAWFDQADLAMLKVAAQKQFQALNTQEKLQQLIMAKLKTLGTHRRVSRQMLFSKLEPGHFHTQYKALLRLQRTVAWLREATNRRTVFLKRQFEEMGLASIYSLTFFYWLYDDSADANHTEKFLEERLQHAHDLSVLCSRLKKIIKHKEA